MIVLGVHVGHDSAAALVIDGRVVADVAEERFARIKHYAGLPIRAIDYCLTSQGITSTDVDVVAVPSKYAVPQLNELFSLSGRRSERPGWAGAALEFLRATTGRPGVGPPIYMRRFPLGRKAEILHVEHHLAHAASAYFTSGLRERQLVVTVDGVGDGVSVAIWRGEAGKLTKLDEIGSNGSLGWFYSNVTEALGWWHGDGEGKTMGLAPYGDALGYQGVLDQFAPKYSQGKLLSGHNFGRPFVWAEGGAIQYHFRDSAAIHELVVKHGRANIAAEAQRVLEDQLGNIIYPWLKTENTRHLASAGGVMLNVKANQRLWTSGALDRQHTYPNPGDGGLAAGAALYAFYSQHADTPIHALDDVYHGPMYSNDTIETLLKLCGIKYRRTEDVSQYVAEQLAEGKICAWFQGRMEAGPRALGARSILMSAAEARYKDVINERVKFREGFRPFCPSMLVERASDYLEKAREERFMITSFDCKPSKAEMIPAVVHKDGTLRPQTVVREFAPRYWDLIAKYERLTGEAVILNSSLNVMGEPIVNQPREALRCFFDTGMDVLAIEDFIVEKQ
jgi:carbamoyltransferase